MTRSSAAATRPSRLLIYRTDSLPVYERRAKNPTVDFIHRAAEVLGVSAADLIGDNGNGSRKRPGPPSKMEQQIDELRRLPKAKQRFVSELLDTVLKTAE